MLTNNTIASSKTISFTGKHNIDKINNLNTKTDAKRLHMSDLLEVDITHKAQVDMCNKLYMNCGFDLKSLLEKELTKKLQGYKAQDIKKEIYTEHELINLSDTLEKLIATKLRCYYCKKEVFLLYKNVREPSQWSLDRINNDKCHSKENTVISCLKCNLQRRVTDMEKFTFTKHLTIKKTHV